MEASNVLKEYLELFTADCRQLKLLVAPNAVVDWFGRTVRGPAKIHDYFRFDVALHYEHENFDKAEECEPIEQRPSHWKTKSLPAGDIDFVLPLNKVTGLTSLKSYAESDLEDDDDLEMHPLPTGNQTPEHQSNTSIAPVGELTPPSSTIKLENAAVSGTESDSDADDGATAPKRLKRTLPKAFNYLRRLTTSSTKPVHVSKRRTLTTQYDMQMLGDDTSSDEELDADYHKKLANEYTPLKYIEAKGMLRGKPQMLNSTDTPPTPHSTSAWDRPVRLRISYRRNLADQQLQIALVIYEHIKIERDSLSTTDATVASTLGTRRRNLMAQFNEAASSESSMTTLEDVDHTEERVTVATTEIGTTAVSLTDVLLDEDEAITSISVVPLRTPTKSVHTPPATPKRQRRVPYSMSGMKRIGATPSSSTSTPKRNAARTLRL